MKLVFYSSTILQYLYKLRCFNDYTTQLHVSALIGHRQVFFKRTYGATLYTVRARDGEISTSGICCVICNFFIGNGVVFSG